jgi:hypothetical protein
MTGQGLGPGGRGKPFLDRGRSRRTSRTNASSVTERYNRRDSEKAISMSELGGQGCLSVGAEGCLMEGWLSRASNLTRRRKHYVKVLEVGLIRVCQARHRSTAEVYSAQARTPQTIANPFGCCTTDQGSHTCAKSLQEGRKEGFYLSQLANMRR